MDNVKNDKYYLENIIDDLNFIVCHMDGVGIDELNENEILLDSMMFRLIQVSENAKQLSEDIKCTHPEIPWNAVNGLRNRIVHDYGHVDLRIVYDTLVNDIPELLGLLQSI